MTPIWVIDAVGISHELKQIAAMTVGGIAGVAGLVGASLLLHRRLFEPRIRHTSSFGDITVLVLLWVQLILGVGTLWWSWHDLNGAEMVRLMNWAHGLSVFCKPGRPRLAGRRADHLQAAYRAGADHHLHLAVHQAGACLERADLVPVPPRLSDCPLAPYHWQVAHSGPARGGAVTRQERRLDHD